MKVRRRAELLHGQLLTCRARSAHGAPCYAQRALVRSAAAGRHWCGGTEGVTAAKAEPAAAQAQPTSAQVAASAHAVTASTQVTAQPAIAAASSSFAAVAQPASTQPGPAEPVSA